MTHPFTEREEHDFLQELLTSEPADVRHDAAVTLTVPNPDSYDLSAINISDLDLTLKEGWELAYRRIFDHLKVGRRLPGGSTHNKLLHQRVTAYLGKARKKVRDERSGHVKAKIKAQHKDDKIGQVLALLEAEGVTREELVERLQVEG